MKTTYNKIKDKILWNEQFKVRPRNNASRKHEVIKLFIVLNLLEKYRKNLYWIRIYTEFQVAEGRICDVYFENLKTNEIIAYEIQKNTNKQWLKETQDFYKNVEKMFFTIDWVLIEENKLPDDIEELNKQIKELLI